MPPHFSPYIKSIKWHAENACVIYDEPAENIMTTKLPEQLQVYCKDHLTLEIIPFFYKELP